MFNVQTLWNRKTTKKSLSVFLLNQFSITISVRISTSRTSGELVTVRLFFNQHTDFRWWFAVMSDFSLSAVFVCAAWGFFSQVANYTNHMLLLCTLNSIFWGPLLLIVLDLQLSKLFPLGKLPESLPLWLQGPLSSHHQSSPPSLCRTNCLCWHHWWSCWCQSLHHICCSTCHNSVRSLRHSTCHCSWNSWRCLLSAAVFKVIKEILLSCNDAGTKATVIMAAGQTAKMAFIDSTS